MKKRYHIVKTDKSRFAVSRFLNIGVGAIYTVIMGLLLFVAPWYFYKLFAGVEVALTATIVVMAWRWPRSITPA